MRIESASRRSRSALSASRACRRTTWPGWTSAAIATWPGLRVGADEPAHEEVALQVVGLVGVDDDPDEQPALDEPQVLGRELLDRLAQLLQRRLARQLADHVALAGGDRQLGADRRRALGDHRQHLDAVQPHADRAVADDLVADEQHGLVVERPRPEASPPSSGSIGVDSVRKRRTASVGKVTGSASRIAPSAPDRSAMPVSAPVPSSSSSTVGVERRRRAVARGSRPTPTPRSRPRSPARGRSRRRRRSRSARRARGSRGSPPAPPRAPRASRPRRTRPRGRRARRRARRAAADAASSAAVRGSGDGRQAGADADGHDGLTILRAHELAAGLAILIRRARGHRRLRPHGRGQDRRRHRARRAAARARGGPGRGLRGRDAGLRGPADPHRRGDRAEQAPARAPAARLRADRPRPSPPARSPQRAHARDRRAARRRTGARSSSAAPACTCARRSPSSTSRPPVDPAIRAALARATRARSPSCTPRCPTPSRRASSPPTASASCARTSCSPPATSRRRPRRAVSCGRRTPATRRCSPRW